MSDTGPIIPLTSGRSFGDKSADELEAMLDSLTFDGKLQDEVVVPEPTPEPVPEAEPVAEAAPEAEPEIEAAPEAEPEMDLETSEREGDRIKMQKLEAALLLQQAHAARLAGEIGFLRNQKPAPSEPYEPQSEAELDRLSLLEQRLAQQEAQMASAKVSQAIDQSLLSMDGPWVEEFKDEIAALAPKYKEQLDVARASSDPELARQISTGIALAIKAEAREIRWEQNHKSLVEKKASTRADNDRAKRAVAASASGTVPAAPPKSKTFADFSVAEADAWLKENVR